VQVDVNENDMPNVKVDDPVVITIDAYPDRKFSGIVKEIASSAESTGGTGSGSAAQATGSSTTEVTNYLVKIRVSDRDVQLRPGMSATADIETQTVANVISVPIQSVTVRAKGGLTAEELNHRQSGGEGNPPPAAVAASAHQQARLVLSQLQRVVFIRTGAKARLQVVETGIADNDYIEVRRGVQVGDEIISGSYAAVSRLLKNDSLVYVEKPKPPAAAN
jgi:HlyD family secretion protein